MSAPTIADIQDKLASLKADERLTYKPALIQINAPLALIQVSLKCQVNTLEWVLGLPLSRFPLKPKSKGHKP